MMCVYVVNNFCNHEIIGDWTVYPHTYLVYGTGHFMILALDKQKMDPAIRHGFATLSHVKGDEAAIIPERHQLQLQDRLETVRL